MVNRFVFADPTEIVPTDPTIDRIDWALDSKSSATYLGAGQSSNVSPSTLIDGLPADNSTYVCTNNSSNQRLLIDLGAVREIDRIEYQLWDGDNRFHQYYIETSENNTDYTQPSASLNLETGEHRGYKRHNFPTTSARYVRFVGTGGTNQYLCLRSEILIIGSRIAPPQPVLQRLDLDNSSKGTTFSAGKLLQLNAGIYEVKFKSGAISQFANDSANGGRTWEVNYNVGIPLFNKTFELGFIHDKLSRFATAQQAEVAYANDGANQGAITVNLPVNTKVYFWINTGNALRGSETLEVKQISGPNDSLLERIRDGMTRSVLREQKELANWQSWVTNRSCYGCHIHGEGAYGLQDSKSKLPNLPVSSAFSSEIVDAFRNWQRTTGSASTTHGGHPVTETSLWAWGLGSYSWTSSERGLFALARGANWLITQQQAAGGWNADHGAGTLYADGTPSATHTTGNVDMEVALLRFLNANSFAPSPDATIAGNRVTENANVANFWDISFDPIDNVTGIKLVVSDSYQSNGNFVLNEFESFFNGVPLTHSSASANSSQGGFPIANTINGNWKNPNDGWAYNPQNVRSIPAEAVFRFASPSTVDAVRINQIYSDHQLKQFSLLYTTDTNPTFQPVPILKVGLASHTKSRFQDSLVSAAKQYLRTDWAYTRNIRTTAQTGIGLKVAFPYLNSADQALATTRLEQVDARLRATQATDGGWIDNGSKAIPSSPFASAQALKALVDINDDKIDDAMVKATEFLLGRQLSTGMWSSPEHSTQLASTTWVQIALPTIFEQVLKTTVQNRIVIEDLLARGEIGSVRLRWTPLKEAASYNIYRKTDSSPYLLISTNYTPPTGEFIDEKVTPGTVYYYIVKWVDGIGGESEESTEPSAVPYALQCGGGYTPEIITAPVTRAPIGEWYEYQVGVLDQDQDDRLNFELIEAPAGMTIDPNRGLIRFLPTAASAGLQRVKVKVTDSFGMFATQGFKVFIRDKFENLAPYITSEPTRDSQIGRDYLYQVVAFDKNPDDTLSYTLDAAPAGMSFSGSTLKWTPTNTGTFPVKIRVTDAGGLSATQFYDITVASNQPPLFITKAPELVQAGRFYLYPARALDPEGQPVTYSITNPPQEIPSAMTLNPSTGELSWPTPSTVLTTDLITLRATDPQGLFAEQSFAIRSVANTPPQIISNAVTQAGIGVPYVYQVEAIDEETPKNKLQFSLTKSQTGMTITPAGRITWTPQSENQGMYEIGVQVQDEDGLSSSQIYNLTVKSGGSGYGGTLPEAISNLNGNKEDRISVPKERVVSKITPVAIDLDPMGSGPFTWESRLAPCGEEDFSKASPLSSGTSDGAPLLQVDIGPLDPTVLQNDCYNVILHTNRSGREVDHFIPFEVSGELKLGRFQYATTDLLIPLGRLSLPIERAYDSFDKTSNDFGKGWRIRYPGNVKDTAKKYPFPYYYTPSTKVFVTLPDGRRTRYSFKPYSTFFLFPYIQTPSFKADAGVYDKLEVDPGYVIHGGGMYLSSFTDGYNPKRFYLTAKDGTKYTLDKEDGLQEIRDRNNNYIKINPNSLEHSSGINVRYERDFQGRIRKITDLNGGVLSYAYNNLGQLASATNQNNETTSYKYDIYSRLTEIIDPLGRTVLKNIFDDVNGRLIKQIDGEGKEQRFEYDLDEKEEVAFDRRGNKIRFRYDDNGNLLTKIDSKGRATSYTYDENFNINSETDARGNVWRYGYDAQGNKIEEIDPLGNKTRKTFNKFGAETDVVLANEKKSTKLYDDYGSLLEEKDFEGNTKKYQYDDDGMPISYTDARGNKWEIQYDAMGRLLKRKDPLGTEFGFKYDANGNELERTISRTLPDSSKEVLNTKSFYDNAGNLEKIIHPDGKTEKLEHDASGEIVAVTDRQGTKYQAEYNKRGNRIKTVYPDNSFEAAEYDENNNVVSFKDRLGRVTTYDYDDLNRHVKTTFADGSTEKIEYDDANNVTARITPRGGRYQYSYDSSNRVGTEKAPESGTRTYQYDKVGNRVGWIDERGYLTKFEYDGNKKLRRAIFPEKDSLTATKEWQYDQAGNLIAEINELGERTEHAYDSLARKIQTKDPLGSITKYTYDEIGNLISESDPNNQVTKIEYDKMGQEVKRTLPLGMAMSKEYDAVGNVLSITDYNGRKKKFEYSLESRLISETDANNAKTSYGYDLIGNRTSVIDANNNKTEFAYDNRNRVIQKKDPRGGVTIYDYNPSGGRSSITERTGKRRELEYDLAERLKEERWYNGVTQVKTFTFSYDDAGNKVFESDGATKYSYQYDSRNRLIVEDNEGTTSLPRLILSYEYDKAGNHKSTSDNYGAKINSLYDPRNMLSSRAWQSDSSELARIDFNYNAVGDKSSIERFSDFTGTNRISKTAFSYDSNRRATSQSNLSPTLTPFSNYTYNYNAGSELTRETFRGENSNFTYDNVGQLISADNALKPDETFTYDALGNRTNTGYVTSAGNLVTKDQTFDYTYDLDGNLILKKNRTTNETTEYGYDHRNRLVSSVDKNNLGDEIKKVTFGYDTRDRRVTKTVDGITTKMLYDKDHVWADYTQADTLLSRYLFGDKTDEILARDSQTSGLACYLPDKLGTVREIVDANGQQINQPVYNAFGTVVSETGPPQGDRYKFTGREYDPETGLYYYRARYYDPKLGRFISEDPLGFEAGDGNVYRYVFNSPGNFIDPSGKEAAVGYLGSLRPALISAPAVIQLGEITFINIAKGVVALVAADFILQISRGNVKDTGVMDRVYDLINKIPSLNPCDALDMLAAEARAAGNTALALKIKATQKALGCRRSRS